MGRKSTFEAMPRENAVKVASTPDQMTPKALLAERLQRLYQPAAEAQSDRFSELLIELQERVG